MARLEAMAAWSFSCLGMVLVGASILMVPATAFADSVTTVWRRVVPRVDRIRLASTTVSVGVARMRAPAIPTAGKRAVKSRVGVTPIAWLHVRQPSRNAAATPATWVAQIAAQTD